MSVVVYCFPPFIIESRYALRDNFLILNRDRLHGRVRGEVFDEILPRYPKSAARNLKVDPHSLLQRIRNLGPIWVRWSGRGDRYELLAREFLLRSLALAEQFKSRGVNVAIFHTAINHHIDSSIVQLACSIAAIPQIFLYHEPVGNRLLPMIQLHNVYDRRPLGFEVSDYSAKSDIDKFRLNALNGKPPIHNYRSANIDKSLFLNYFSASWADIKSALRNIFYLQNDSEKTIENFALSSSIGQFQSQALSQWRALKSYESMALDIEQLKKNIGPLKNFYIIAAHHQPEATSFPEGGHNDNHIDIVLNLRLSGYLGPIVYKEHPTIWNYSEAGIFSRVAVSRSIDYYKSLAALGVIFLCSNVPLQKVSELFPESKVVTITGSIALERAFRGQSTLVVGQPWYKKLPYTVSIDVHEDWHTVISRWAEDDIAVVGNDRVQEFLSNLLSGKTISNVTGVGILEVETSRIKIESGLKEHDRLLDYLLENGFEDFIKNVNDDS